MISDDELFVTLDHMHSVPAFNGRAGFCHKGGAHWLRGMVSTGGRS